MAGLNNGNGTAPGKRPLIPGKGIPESMVEPNIILVLANRYLRWIIVVIIVVVAFAAYGMLLSDKISQVKTAAEESLPAKEKILEDLNLIQRELDAIVIEFDAIRSSRSDVFERFEYLLPDEPKHADLFTMLDDLARKHGLLMSSVNFAIGNAPRNTRTDRRFDEVPATTPGTVQSMTINMSVQGGTYEIFKQYLDTLENNIRLFDVQSVSFDGGGFQVSTDGTVGVPSYSIEMVTYYRAAPQATAKTEPANEE